MTMDCCEILFFLLFSEAGLWTLYIKGKLEQNKKEREKSEDGSSFV